MLKDQCAVISDIHGNSWALKAVLQDIKNRGINNIVNLGDSLYGPLDPAGTADILVKLDIPTVCGNEDRLIFDDTIKTGKNATLDFVRNSLTPVHWIWLKSLKMIISLGNEFLMFHGTPKKDTEYLIWQVQKNGVFLRKNSDIFKRLKTWPEEIILCGHDHKPQEIYLQDQKIIVNPGSVGLPAYTDDLPYPHIMETGLPHARYSLIKKDESGLWVQHVAVPYDWETAAGVAEKNGRPDWSMWLRTGRAHRDN